LQVVTCDHDLTHAHLPQNFNLAAAYHQTSVTVKYTACSV